MPVLADCYGEADASLWWQRWRIFFMACAELFAWDEGVEWYVGHYLFRKAGR
jgi:cyclopropane-fatty-acyl-phospholipid synthase